MTIPSESFVIVPDDSLNTGKKVRSIYGSVAGETVYSHFYTPVSIALIKGVYYSTSALFSVLASAQDGTSTAVWWLQLGSSATVNVRVRKLEVAITNAVATAIDHPSAPRLVFARGTHTGTWAGATQATVKRKTSDSSAQADVRTAVTGATPVLGNAVWSALIPGMDFTTAGVYNSYSFQTWKIIHEDEFLDIAPGECLICYQADNGTASDQRRLIVNLEWDEYDNQ